jgi:predicted metal-dependent peptidase
MPFEPIAEIKPVTDEDIKKAINNLREARMKLLFSHPFFGQLALRLELTPADPSWCPTAATDGRKFYFNPHFVNALPPGENVFLAAHELGHCIYEHFTRREGRDPKMWNIAGDYVINNMLDNEIVQGSKCAEVITKVKPFLDHKYDGWTSEEIYDDLMDQKDNGGKPEEDGELIDVHIDMNGDGQGSKDGDGTAKGNGSGNSDSDGDGKLAGIPGEMTEEERKSLQNSMRDAVIQAAQSVGAGNVPGDVRRMIADLVEPKMDWRDIIRSQIESSIKSNYTFLRPNRRGWHMAAVLPGMDNDFKIDVCLAIDTSGSISQQMLTEFISEVAGIMEEYEEYRIRIWQFDTQVYGYDEFTSDDGRDATEYQITGGGGTDFMCNWTYMKENEIEPDQFIMFTDGMPYSSWGDENYCDTVFLIHTGGYGSKPEAPFGVSVYYEDHHK